MIIYRHFPLTRQRLVRQYRICRFYRFSLDVFHYMFIAFKLNVRIPRDNFYMHCLLKVALHNLKNNFNVRCTYFYSAYAALLSITATGASTIRDRGVLINRSVRHNVCQDPVHTQRIKRTSRVHRHTHRRITRNITELLRLLNEEIRKLHNTLQEVSFERSGC